MPFSTAKNCRIGIYRIEFMFYNLVLVDPSKFKIFKVTSI